MIDLVVVSLYLLVNIVVGVYIGCKVKSQREWSLGKGDYSKWMVFITLFAAFIGGGFTLGLSEKTYIYGLFYVLAIWGFSIKEVMIAKFIAPRVANQFKNFVTVGDVMKVGFGDKAKSITGIASILVCSGVIGAQLSACGNILNLFLDIPNVNGTLLTVLLIISYIIVGGIRATISLDIIHFSLILVILPLTAIVAVHDFGGITYFINSLPQQDKLLSNISAMEFIVLFMSFFLGETLIPPYFQRLLIGKNTQQTILGTKYAGYLSFIFFAIIGIIGVIAFHMNPALDPALSMPYVMMTVLPIGLKGLAIAAMLSVILSSSNSFINSTSIAVCQDVLPEKLMQNKLLSFRVATIMIILIATAFALGSRSALDILLYSYQFWTPIILVPLIMVIYGFRGSNYVFIYASIFSGLTVVLWQLYSPFQVKLDGALEGVIVGVLSNIVFYATAYRMNYLKKHS